MSSPTKLERESALVRRYDYGDASVVVADTDLPDEAVSVDVIDGTAIVVVETGDEGEDAQYELDVPDGEAEAFINNGVVTVEVRR